MPQLRLVVDQVKQRGHHFRIELAAAALLDILAHLRIRPRFLVRPLVQQRVKHVDHGNDARGLGAWIPSALVGLCFVNLPGQFVGPLGNLADGIDISLPVTLGLASVVYLVLLSLFPEPKSVFGPDDLRSEGTAPLDASPVGARLARD